MELFVWFRETGGWDDVAGRQTFILYTLFPEWENVVLILGKR